MTIDCVGNCFTKPLMCWSLLDWTIILGGLAVLWVLFVIAEMEYRRRNNNHR